MMKELLNITCFIAVVTALVSLLVMPFPVDLASLIEWLKTIAIITGCGGFFSAFIILTDTPEKEAPKKPVAKAVIPDSEQIKPTVNKPTKADLIKKAKSDEDWDIFMDELNGLRPTPWDEKPKTGGIRLGSWVNDVFVYDDDEIQEVKPLDAKATLVYYLRIEHNGRLFYKIGITYKQSVAGRFGSEDMKKITVLFTKRQTDRKAALAEESHILKTFKRYQYKGRDILKSGNTEIFTKDVLEIDPLNNAPKGLLNTFGGAQTIEA